MIDGGENLRFDGGLYWVADEGGHSKFHGVLDSLCAPLCAAPRLDLAILGHTLELDLLSRKHVIVSWQLLHASDRHRRELDWSYHQPIQKGNCRMVRLVEMVVIVGGSDMVEVCWGGHRIDMNDELQMETNEKLTEKN